MPAKLPRVALLIETSRTYGRGIIRGIARYARVHGPWSFFTEERELHSGIPDRLQSWNVDDIIARIEGKRMAGILSRCGCWRRRIWSMRLGAIWQRCLPTASACSPSLIPTPVQCSAGFIVQCHREFESLPEFSKHCPTKLIWQQQFKFLRIWFEYE